MADLLGLASAESASASFRTVRHKISQLETSYKPVPHDVGWTGEAEEKLLTLKRARKGWDDIAKVGSVCSRNF